MVMPISAIVGKRRWMSKMEDIFFSGTFGGEALSLAASIATIKKLEALDVPKKLAAYGEGLIGAVRDLICKHRLNDVLAISGLDWWPRLQMKSSDAMPSNVFTSLLRQEFIEQGILAGAAFNFCYAHTSNDIAGETLERIDGAFEVFSETLRSERPANHLRGKPIEPIFKVRA